MNTRLRHSLSHRRIILSLSHTKFPRQTTPSPRTPHVRPPPTPLCLASLQFAFHRRLHLHGLLPCKFVCLCRNNPTSSLVPHPSLEEDAILRGCRRSGEEGAAGGRGAEALAPTIPGVPIISCEQTLLICVGDCSSHAPTVPWLLSSSFWQLKSPRPPPAAPGPPPTAQPTSISPKPQSSVYQRVPLSQPFQLTRLVASSFSFPGIQGPDVTFNPHAPLTPLPMYLHAAAGGS